ncbi:DUF1772 domain-containing protein [Aestuariibacter halophilus]|uniref:DUF1772 domain-containing protein n=1 Tax=Fluctibacter halophilus TaxID=226011 RepID=A0ABS8GC20_9ALTE|nr:anthrone oxygenase family protein [Aestuariibacter halophilus]MCC2618122.1 DUF1772 domain-containing protein [Aestuariibacter halophilus]
METSLLFFAMVLSGVMTGVYFVFSVFVMKALGAIPVEQGMAAMNSINRVILNSLFIPVFFLSSLVALSLVILALDELSVLASVAYLLGMFLCTVMFNVPLNNALQSVSAAERNSTWQHYLRVWTRWNHVRTVSCLMAFVGYGYAMVQA